LLKAKETIDITKLYQEFDDEKNKMISKLESYKNKNCELLKEVEELREQNDSLEKREFKLKQEVEKFKIKLGDEKLEYQDGVLCMKFDKHDPRERDEMKRSIASKREAIALLDKKYLKLKLSLQTEIENSEKLINDLELNEKGLEELNKKNKSLLLQLQENNEKMAKMTNEKSKDLHTIKLLNEEKDILDRRMKDQEALIQTYQELNKKFEQDLAILKEIRLKEDQEYRQKSEEIESLKKTIISYYKNNEELRGTYENALSALNISQGNSAKNLTNYEQLKIKYENLCKIKNIYNEYTGKAQSYEDLVKENGILTCEVDTYRVYIFNLGNT
jgi:hypothetical protein